MCTQGPVCKGRGGLFLHGLSVQVLTRPFRCMHSTQSTASMSTIGGLPSRQSFYVPIDTHQGSGLPQFWSHTLMSMLHSIDHLRTGVGVSEHSCGVHPPHLGITGSHATSAGSRGVRERWRCAVARARGLPTTLSATAAITAAACRLAASSRACCLFSACTSGCHAQDLYDLYCLRGLIKMVFEHEQGAALGYRCRHNMDGPQSGSLVLWHYCNLHGCSPAAQLLPRSRIW